MPIDGDIVLKAALDDLEIDLASLVAHVSIWADPKTFNILKADNGYGVFYPNTRRYRAGQGEAVGNEISGVYLDSNNYANTAIKRAVGVDRNIKNFTACHIWPDSCYDERYHTCIANIVLIPSPISGISDHDGHTVDCLKYRSYELYGWHPLEAIAPTKPDGYPTQWNQPVALNETIEGYIQNRRRQ